MNTPTITSALSFEQRVERLAPLTHCGPDYNRMVHEHACEALRWHRIREQYPSNGQTAEYWLLKAELAAGFVSFDEFQTQRALVNGRLV